MRYSLLIATLLLSGCTGGYIPMQDYDGRDAAWLRVENGSEPLQLQSYRKVGTCLQQVDEKLLPADSNALGFRKVDEKHIAGIAATPGGSPLTGREVMEYRIQAGRYLQIGYQVVTPTTPQTVTSNPPVVYSSYRSFIAQEGHSYEAYVTSGGNWTHPVMIVDISDGASEVAEQWPLKECRYEISLLGKKVYQ